MRVVIYEDGDGFKHISHLRDTDHISRVAEGIHTDPPDIRVLDWDAIRRELNNLLVDRRILTTRDLSLKPGQLENTILAVLRARLVNLYREQEKGDHHGP